MALDLQQHPTTSSPSTSSLSVKVKSEYPDDYMNEVQDLRCRNNGGTDSSGEKQSENDIHGKNLSTTAAAEEHKSVADAEDLSATRHTNGDDHEQEKGRQDGPEGDSVFDRTAIQISVSTVFNLVSTLGM